MKKLASIALAIGLFTATGCNKCLNCDCTFTTTQTTTTVTTDGLGGSDTVINTDTGNASNSMSGVCDGDEVLLQNGHFVDSGNIDGTHTYTDTNVNVQDNFLNSGTTTTTTVTTTTYNCTCDSA